MNIERSLPDCARCVPELRGALHQLLTGAHINVPVRAEILESWLRAASHGLRPDGIDPPYDDSFHHGDVLERAARPVLTDLADDLAGTTTTVVLADDRGRIIRRWDADRLYRHQLDRIRLAPGYQWSERHVGTCGVGTALQRRAPTFVAGDEHFADALTTICSAAAPIFESRSGRVAGVVSVCRYAPDATGLMMVMALQAARAVAQRVRHELDGRMSAIRTDALHIPLRKQPPMRSGARFGWASLTQTELVVAELVAEGRRNRQVAAELFMSPHTVDAHLRHIYRKLGITSRVELTRLVLSRDDRDVATRYEDAVG